MALGKEEVLRASNKRHTVHHRQTAFEKGLEGVGVGVVAQ